MKDLDILSLNECNAAVGCVGGAKKQKAVRDTMWPNARAEIWCVANEGRWLR